MTLEEYTKDKILEDVRGLQYLFELKEVIRSHQSRDEKDTTESVAEHVFGMHMLSQYFIPLENPDGGWNKSLISELINFHDIDEIETGDIMGWMKTPEDRIREEEAQRTLLTKVPSSIKSRIEELLIIYREQRTSEARFVKAIDKLEPHIHFYREKRRIMFQLNKATAEKAMSIKEPYVKAFPFIKRCNEIIHEALLDGDYYYKESE